MAFFNSAVTVLQTLVIALGAGLGIWGAINLLEGYGNDNPGANAQRLEEAFYSSKTPDPVEDTEPKTADTAVTESDESDAAKILELLKNPETAALLKQLAKAL